MTAELGPVPSSAGLTPVTTWNRIYGLGSVYAKTLRDSRLAVIIVDGLIGGMLLYLGAALPNVFSTPEARAEIVRLANSLSGAASGIAGNPVNVGTLGGYIAVEVRPGLPVGRRRLVDPRLVVHARDRGAPRQPRVRRRNPVREASYRARKAGRDT